ncbi:MAG: MFS transporter [Pseudomonadota bacterium]
MSLRGLAGALGSIATRALSGACAGALAIALPWTVLADTGDPRLAGLAALVLQGPAVILGLFAGRLVGHWAPRRAVLVSDAGCAVLLALAAACLALGWLWPGLAVAGLANGVAAPGNAVQAARAADLARRARWSLARFNGIGDGLTVVALFGAGAAAAAALAHVDVASIVAATAALATLVAVLDALLFPALRANRRPEARSLSAGLRALAADRTLGVVVLACLAVVAVYQSMDDVTVPSRLLAEGAGPERLAPYVLGSCAGVIAGSLVIAAAGRRLPGVAAVAVGATLVAIGVFAIDRLPIDWLASAGLVLGIGAGLLSPAATTLLQQRTLPASRLAVLGAVSAGVESVGPLGSVGAGVLIAGLGLGIATPVLGTVALSAAVFVAVAGIRPRGAAA